MGDHWYDNWYRVEQIDEYTFRLVDNRYGTITTIYKKKLGSTGRDVFVDSNLYEDRYAPLHSNRVVEEDEYGDLKADILDEISYLKSSLADANRENQEHERAIEEGKKTIEACKKEIEELKHQAINTLPYDEALFGKACNVCNRGLNWVIDPEYRQADNGCVPAPITAVCCSQEFTLVTRHFVLMTRRQKQS